MPRVGMFSVDLGRILSPTELCLQAVMAEALGLLGGAPERRNQRVVLRAHVPDTGLSRSSRRKLTPAV